MNSSITVNDVLYHLDRDHHRLPGWLVDLYQQGCVLALPNSLKITRGDQSLEARRGDVLLWEDGNLYSMSRDAFERREAPKVIPCSQGTVLDKTLLNLIGDAPNMAPLKKQLHGLWYETTLPIGPDHTATLLISDEALDELRKRCNHG